MLKKLISGLCVLGLVCTLMTGCTEDELKEIEEKSQEYDRQYKEKTGVDNTPKNTRVNNRTYENKAIWNIKDK